jgi:hypothetical protein
VPSLGDENIRNGRTTMNEKPGRLNVLVLYNDYAVETAYVKEHVSAIGRHSRHLIHYLPATRRVTRSDVIERYDAIIIHFSVRLPFPEALDPELASAIARFPGAKIAMPQDEYDLPLITTRRLIELGIHVAFTTVPEPYRAAFYPPDAVRGIDFYSCLTGYADEDRQIENYALPLDQRKIAIAYRGRRLPVWYGALADQKATIGLKMRQECAFRGIAHDIDVTEEARLLGDAWYQFLGSARAMLSSESGSNVVDPVGLIRAECERLVRMEPPICRDQIYRRAVAPCDGQVVMNQISPKIFEAARLRTCLLLVEGDWSGVLRPQHHYIALRRDWRNIDEVLASVMDDGLVTEMTNRAYADLIQSGKYSYAKFIHRIDDAVDAAFARCHSAHCLPYVDRPAPESVDQPAKYHGEWPDGCATLVPAPAPPEAPPLPQSVPQHRPREPILSGKLRRIWMTVPSPIRIVLIAMFGRAVDRLAAVARDQEKVSSKDLHSLSKGPLTPP